MLQVVKEVSPDTASIGDTVDFFVFVENTGPGMAYAVVLNDSLRVVLLLTFVSPDPSGPLGDMSEGAREARVVTARVVSDTSCGNSNQASATSANAASASDTVSVTLIPTGGGGGPAMMGMSAPVVPELTPTDTPTEAPTLEVSPTPVDSPTAEPATPTPADTLTAEPATPTPMDSPTAVATAPPTAVPPTAEATTPPPVDPPTAEPPLPAPSEVAPAATTSGTGAEGTPPLLLGTSLVWLLAVLRYWQRRR